MAIAFDAGSAADGATGTSQTLSHTVTGSDTILWVGGFSNNSSIPSGATFNGTTMTGSVSQLNNSPNGNESLQLFYLPAAATGTHNIVVTWSSSNPNPSVSGASFTGATQSAVTEGTNIQNGTATSVTCSITTSADNCMAVMYVRPNATAAAGTNSTVINATTPIARMFYSTTAKTPAGSMSMQSTFSSAAFTALMAAFPPVSAAGPANLKSRSGNLKANIKTNSGNTLANMKSLSGNS